MSLKLPKRMRVHTSVNRSREQEKELAGRIGGRTIIASGALQEKGDVRKKRVVRIEAKTTMNKSFSVTRDMVRKIEEAALPADEVPVICVEFLRPDGSPDMEVAVVPSYFVDMIIAWKEEKGL